MLFAILILLLIPNVVVGKTAVIAQMIVSHPLQGLMESTVNTETGIGSIVSNALGTDNTIWCQWVCPKPGGLTDCYDCGMITGDYSPSPELYFIVYFGYTTHTDLEPLSNLLMKSLENLFGAKNIERSGISPFSNEVPIWVHVRVNTSLKEIISKEDHLLSSVRIPFTDPEAEIFHCCDEINYCVRWVQINRENPSEEKKTYRLTIEALTTLNHINRLDEMVGQIQEPVEQIFGSNNVYPTWYSTGMPLTQTPAPWPSTAEPSLTPGSLTPTSSPLTSRLPSTSPPATATSSPPSKQQRVILIYVISINFNTLISNSLLLTARTQTALGGNETAECIDICAMQQIESNYTSTEECYSCGGESLLRAVSVKEVMRWGLRISGMSLISKKEFTEDLDAALRDFIRQIGGTLETIEVSSESLPTTPNNSDSDNDLSDGVIVGVVIGCVVFIIIIIVITYWLCQLTDDNCEQQSEPSKEAPDVA